MPASPARDVICCLRLGVPSNAGNAPCPSRDENGHAAHRVGDRLDSGAASALPAEWVVASWSASQASAIGSICYRWTMETISSTDAKNQLNRLLNDVKAGMSFTITSHGQPVAQLIPIVAAPRRFGQLPNLVVPDDFDDALPAAELAAWEAGPA